MISWAYTDNAHRWLLWLIGWGLLLLGALVYVLARGGDAYFVPAFLQDLPPIDSLRHLTNQLPTFLHTFAFAAFLAAVWAASKRAVISLCVAVTLVELLTELGQYSPVAQFIAAHFPAPLYQVPILELIPGYVLNGTYDPWDLVSIVAGGALAMLIALRIQKPEKTNDQLER